MVKDLGRREIILRGTQGSESSAGINTRYPVWNLHMLGARGLLNGHIDPSEPSKHVLHHDGAPWLVTM